MVRDLVLYLLLFISFDLFSQEEIHLERTDPVKNIPIQSLTNPEPLTYKYSKKELIISPLLRNTNTIHIPPVKRNDLSFLKEEFNLSGVVREFEYGTLLGEGTQRNLPGIGWLNQAGLSYYST